jgi:hypothetical protein
MPGTRKKGSSTVAINQFLQEGAFEPQDIKAMSMALNDVCQALSLADGHAGRAVIAIRIIELARRGERSPTRLRDRVLSEANGLVGLAAPVDEKLRQQAHG